MPKIFSNKNTDFKQPQRVLFHWVPTTLNCLFHSQKFKRQTYNNRRNRKKMYKELDKSCWKNLSNKIKYIIYVLVVIKKLKIHSLVSFTLWNHLIKRSHPDPGRREKINLHLYFQTSLWCPKGCVTGLHKTFWGITKKCEITI